MFVFGSGDQDEEYCTSAGWTLAKIEEACLIVARGTFTIDDGERVVKKKEDEVEYFRVMEESLKVAAERRIPMVGPSFLRSCVLCNKSLRSCITYDRFAANADLFNNSTCFISTLNLFFHSSFC